MATREENDLLRTQFKGGKVLLSPSVWDLEPRLRARALYRMTLYHTFEDEDDDHSAGVFIFAGYVFLWHIDFDVERTLTLDIQER